MDKAQAQTNQLRKPKWNNEAGKLDNVKILICCDLQTSLWGMDWHSNHSTPRISKFRLLFSITFFSPEEYPPMLFPDSHSRGPGRPKGPIFLHLLIQKRGEYSHMVFGPGLIIVAMTEGNNRNSTHSQSPLNLCGQEKEMFTEIVKSTMHEEY